MEVWLIIGGLLALVIFFVGKKAKSDVRREISEEALENVEKSKKARAGSRSKSIIDELRAFSKNRRK